MKKKTILLVTVLCFGILFTGCDKAKETTTKSNNKNSSVNAKIDQSMLLVGKWEYESGGFTYTFNANLTGTYDAEGTIMNFTYKTNGDQLFILFEGYTTTFDTTYNIDGKKLTIKDSLNQDVVYIKK